MVTVRLASPENFIRGLLMWEESVEQETADVANGIAVELFNQVLALSPQFSGDFAGNWKYSINHVDTTFTRLRLYDGTNPLHAFKEGAMPAIMHAKQANRGKDSGYKLGDSFYISNSAVHDDPYALWIEEGLIKFREGNHAAPIARAFTLTAPKYKYISQPQAQRLKRKKL